ncbi:MAG: SMC family ATPase [Gemmatimonadetes bacterium]|nr:SMC family ATPase [Gemmatimonadota bacterium]
MKLHRVHLVNFRQHADTEIVFGDGLTGIIGPNGSGKTTLLEAIAWAIYGNAAVRGDKEGMRNLRAKARSSVVVELEFGLGKHEFRVVRRLHDAVLYQDGAPVANSIREVTDRLGRALGMQHDEFFNTYFTGQKELAVMAALKPTERAGFLARILGYERLRVAQSCVRDRRNAINASLEELVKGLPDPAAIEAERRAAQGRLDGARHATREAEAARRGAREVMDREEPHWKAWVERRERTLSLDGERRIAEHAVEAAKQEHERLNKELAEAVKAANELKRLDAELAPIARLKEELSELERLQKEETARRAEQGKLEELQRTVAALDKRIAELAGATDELALVERDVAAMQRRLEVAEGTAEEERTAWVRDKEYAETKRQELLKQYEEVKEQRDKIKELGPEGECPTCKRPLGAGYHAVMEMLERQLEVIKGDGTYFRQRIEQLASEPEKLREAEQARDTVLAESRRLSGRGGELRAQTEERARAVAQREAAQRRAVELEARVQARPTGYDAARHDAVRAELTRLEPVALEAAALAARAQRAEILVGEAELAEKELSRRERLAKELVTAVAVQGFSEEEFRGARERHDRASLALRAAELSVAETRGELVAAEGAVREAERREAERAARERQIAELRASLRLHTELDRAFSELRTKLNAEDRPAIAELASSFLSDLTDGRYDALDLDDQYSITILDDGVPKPVISGGEEDVANLVLRLAISQMIAERAGQPLSLLVLDEIFGSLDESRRQHVLGLLRRLADRFPQVVLITHIESVREGLDRVIRVEYDAGNGTSIVRDDTATLAGEVPGAGVAA